MVNYTTILNQTNGSVAQFVTAPYHDVMGTWFYGLLYFGTFALMYVKTQDFNLTSYVAFIVSAIMLGINSTVIVSNQSVTVLPAELTYIIMIVFSLSATIVLYRIFGR